MFQICLGIPWGADQSVDTNEDNERSLTGLVLIGPDLVFRGCKCPWRLLQLRLGGNVRVGLEDNIYLDRGVLATNGQLVNASR